MHLLGILRLTFRELWARKITLGLFIVASVIWLLMAFALNLDIVDGSLAGLRIFGQGEADLTQTRQDAETGEVVREMLGLKEFVVVIESFVAGATYWGALLLGLFATASLLPGLLESGRAAVLLAKPVSRPRLLAGHVLGVVLVVLALATYLMGMVWLVMSIKTGIWHAPFLLAIGVVVGMFAVMYGVVVLVGVTTESAPLALILSYGLIFSSLILMNKEAIAPQIRLPWRHLFVGFYYVVPGVGEVTRLVAQLAGDGTVTSWQPFFIALLIGALLYALAAVAFQRRDF